MTAVAESIREATANDIPQMHEIRVAVRENRLSDPSRISAEMYGEYLLVRGKGWVSELDGKIVGFAIASRKDKSIWALFLREGYEGRGIGRALLERAVAWLTAQGVDEVWLTTEPGSRADGFYAKLGWVRGDAVPPYGDVRYSRELKRHA